MDPPMRSLGYTISVISVLLLGPLAWPTADEPRWHIAVLVAGIALSVFGMGLRWTASSRQKSELREVERAIGRRQPAE
jgi:hypothetical protein